VKLAATGPKMLFFQVIHFKLGARHDPEEIAELGGLENIENALTEVEKDELRFLLHGAVKEFDHDPHCRRVDILDIFTINAHYFGPFCYLLVPYHFSVFYALNIEFTVDGKDYYFAMIIARNRNHSVLPGYHSDNDNFDVKIKS
jgi:hypothetical protein